MSERFVLTAPFAPAGDQGPAIAKIASGLERGLANQVILGVTGSGKTFVLANIIEKTQRPALVIAPNKTLAAQLYSEFRDFFPKNAVEYFVSYYDYYQPEAYVPARDLYIEKDASINENIEQMRLSATKALLERPDAIVVATVSAIYGLGSPEIYKEMVLSLEPSMKMNRQALIERLVGMQYERSDMEFTRGKMRARGDMVDVFPSEHSKDALRIILGDDTVEGLAQIDALTGKKLRELTRFSLYPASHHAASRETVKKAMPAIEKELSERVKELKGQGKIVEAQRLETRTRFDLEMMAEIGFCKGIENYSRHLTGKKAGQPPATLMDYLPKNALLVIDESHITLPQLGGMHRGDRARKDTLVEFGFRLPSAVDNRPLTLEEFEGKARQTICVSATPADREMESAEEVAELIIRPTGIVDPEIEIRGAQTQVDDLLAQVRATTAKGFRSLVVSLTKKTAEQLSEFMAENKIKTRWMHSEVDNVERAEILRDLRKGVFDALIGINLLREGLDLPEVGLVAVLDADKEGFLRSARSLIQTAGRAARNPEGRVIFYADKETQAIKDTIAESLRRRAKQLAHNKKMGITPVKAHSALKELLDIAPEELGTRGKKNQKAREAKEAKALGLDFPMREKWSLWDGPKMEKEAKRLEREMREEAKNLNFEKAAEIRDEIEALRRHALLDAA